MRYYTLLQLNKSIQKLIQQIQQSFWVTAEITNVSWSNHVYLELAQREGEQLVAKSRANLWADRLIWLKEKLGDDLAFLLREGNKVLLHVSVRYHEVYGLSLEVEDIDLSFTLGELALKKQQALEKLETLGLIDRQKQLRFPLVPQRVAVISSPNAAGWEDFTHQLTGNAFGYGYRVTLFPAGVQGDRALPELLSSLQQIPLEGFDAVVIIRGGGSRLDLEVFNEYELAEAIAQFPLPVLCGLGHQRDRSVADEVAFRQFKTPTAVAEYLIQKTMNFEGALLEKQQELKPLVHDYLSQKKQSLELLQKGMFLQAKQLLSREQQKLNWLSEDVKKLAFSFLKREKNALAALQKYIEILSPEQMLRKGYAIVRFADASPSVGAEVQIETLNQEITATITQVKDHEEK